MTTNNNNDNNGNNDSNKTSDHWLGFSLSPHSSSSNPTTFFNPPSHFNYQNVYYGGVENLNNGGNYSAFPIMPLKSDGSLCLVDTITRSQSQSQPQGVVASTTPKLENFFGSVTMGTPDLDTSTMYYHQNLDHGTFNHNNRHHNYQIQPQSYQDISGLYQTVQGGAKLAGNGCSGLYLPSIEESWISMSPGCSRSTSCVTGHQQQMTENDVVDTKKRGAEKVDQNKQIVHRKSLDTFGQRTSQFRGVTRHRWTGRYEAHLWDNSCKKEGQTRKGRQVYLGGYDMEDKAARAYDLAALKYWGPSTHINFPLENYEQELEEMKNMSRQEYVAHLRRRSSGFSRGASVYRGVTRHHQHGRWQARIGRVAGNKDLYLGTFSTQEDAAEAYDVAAIKFRGVNAVTNFDVSRYDVEKIIASSTLLAGELARRTKVDPMTKFLPNQAQNGEPKPILNEPTSNTSMLDWRMELYHQNTSGTIVEEDESSTRKIHLSKSSGGSSPTRNNNLPITLTTPPYSDFSTETATAITTQVRSHVPVFAAWTDA